jgi:hypothetical protein
MLSQLTLTNSDTLVNTVQDGSKITLILTNLILESEEESIKIIAHSQKEIPHMMSMEDLTQPIVYIKPDPDTTGLLGKRKILFNGEISNTCTKWMNQIGQEWMSLGKIMEEKLDGINFLKRNQFPSLKINKTE